MLVSDFLSLESVLVIELFSDTDIPHYLLNHQPNIDDL